MPDANALLPRLIKRIEAEGPISIADYMAEANGHYYASRDPLGADGDFITAPEISQMFGELVGIWIADLWLRASQPTFRYVELGPGRGTLAADALRAMQRFDCAPTGVHFVEASPSLRAAQSARLPLAIHHENIGDLPDDCALIIIANEFFDALPIRQFVAHDGGWRELMVASSEKKLVQLPGTIACDDDVPSALRWGKPGTIAEASPLSGDIMQGCATRLAQQGGAMLVIDYGYLGPAAGDTLQAVKAHRFTDPFADPGESDLTAHVDFTALTDASRARAVRVVGPVSQADWLRALGIDVRLNRLVAGSPARADDLKGERDRLVNEDEMGRLFQVLAAYAPAWPRPEGFAGVDPTA